MSDVRGFLVGVAACAVIGVGYVTYRVYRGAVRDEDKTVEPATLENFKVTSGVEAKLPDHEIEAHIKSPNGCYPVDGERTEYLIERRWGKNVRITMRTEGIVVTVSCSISHPSNLIAEKSIWLVSIFLSDAIALHTESDHGLKEFKDVIYSQLKKLCNG